MTRTEGSFQYPGDGERLVPNPRGTYNIAWNEAITEVIEVLKRHLSPTHGVISEVKKLIIP